jgi:small-conductance mechanosensitive channel
MDFQPLVNSLTQTLLEIINFIPRLINGLIILIIGYLISWLVRWIVRFVLQHIGFEQVAERTGIHNAMRGLRVRAGLPEIIAQIVFYFLLLSFAASAVRLMAFTTVADLLDSVLRFLPRAVSASVLIIFGSMLARFLGNTIMTIADNVNITYGRVLGRIIEYVVVAFVVVLAISTLGVDTTILTTSLTIIIASTGLAVALTFALGSRESARNVIAGYYVRQNFQPGQQLTLGDYSGTVRTTSGAYTVLEVTGEGGQLRTISLPNSLLLQSGVVGQESGPEANQTNDKTEGSDNPTL